jgi:hypothetical protein
MHTCAQHSLRARRTYAPGKPFPDFRYVAAAGTTSGHPPKTYGPRPRLRAVPTGRTAKPVHPVGYLAVASTRLNIAWLHIDQVRIRRARYSPECGSLHYTCSITYFCRRMRPPSQVAGHSPTSTQLLTAQSTGQKGLYAPSEAVGEQDRHGRSESCGQTAPPNSGATEIVRERKDVETPQLAPQADQPPTRQSTGHSNVVDCSLPIRLSCMGQRKPALVAGERIALSRT